MPTTLDGNATREGRHLTPRQERYVLLCCGWFTIGGFLDGWSHYNGRSDTTFFTPWHAVLYSGFVAAVLAMLWQVRRRSLNGTTGRGAIPAGYGLGLVGAAVFAFGGSFDMVWHQLFGIESGIEALLSPAHLLLFVGSFLLLSSPLRAAWSNPDLPASASRHLLGALLSTAFTTALVAFFLKHHSPFFDPVATLAPYRAIAKVPDPRLAAWLAEQVRAGGVGAVLLMTLVLVAPMLLLVRRWQLPRGSITLLFGIVTVLMTAIRSFALLPTVGAALVAGAVADVLVQRLRPSPLRPVAFWTVASVVAPVLWLAYFAIIAVGPGMAWSVELWAGASGMAALVALGLSVLMVPPSSARYPVTRRDGGVP